MISLITNQGPAFISSFTVYVCCGFILFIISLVAMFYFFLKYSESSSPYEDKKRVNKDKEDDYRTYSSTGMDFEKEKKKEKKVSFFDKILCKKQVCDECGSELVYKESYDSHYCPECRTFK